MPRTGGAAGRRRRRGGVMALAAAVLSATAVVIPASRPAHADIWLVDTSVAAPGPLGGISVIGDSVLLGSGIWAPTLVDQLAARGWGPIRFRSGVGYTTGLFGNKPEVEAAHYVELWRSQGWDPPTIMINIGANDSNTCAGDVTCNYNAIMHVVDAIGPGHKIWWPKITRHPVLIDHQHAFNAALDQVAAERTDFFTWDWPAVMEAYQFSTNDWTHLTPDGYRLRSAMMAREIVAATSTGTRVAGDVALPVASGAASEFVPLPPERVLDTRTVGGGAPVPTGTSVEIDLSSYVPDGSTAVAVNLTSAESNGAGYLTGYACGAVPTVSNVNHAAAVPRGALAVVPITNDRRLCVFTRATGQVIVDLQGAFANGSDDGTRFTPLDTPDRLLDTRETGRAPVIAIDAPDGAEAVAVNLAVTNVTQAGWLKAYPCGGTPPLVSNVNYLPGDSVASAAFVPVADDGTFCVESLVPVDAVVDLTGVFAADGALRFVPVAPTRMLDTRDATGGWSPIQGSGQTFDVGVVPPSAAAVTGTLTQVAPTRPGWLAAVPCGTEPTTSSVNGDVDTVFANSVTVGVENGRVCITALSATHTLFDVTGWWIP